jgi:hypothetical protein
MRTQEIIESKLEKKRKTILGEMSWSHFIHDNFNIYSVGRGSLVSQAPLISGSYW